MRRAGETFPIIESEGVLTTATAATTDTTVAIKWQSYQ
jgi:hypothetical protein